MMLKLESLTVSNVLTGTAVPKKLVWDLRERTLCCAWDKHGAMMIARNAMANESTHDFPSPEHETEKVVESFSVERFQNRTPTFQNRLNKASKWLAASATTAVILWRHDEHVLWAFIGVAVASAIGKAMKKLINDKRPETAQGRKEDAGMPSSHALSLMYLTTYAGLSLLEGPSSQFWTKASACALLLFGVYLSWLRIAEGLHTTPQVLVGALVGSGIASAWLGCWRAYVEDSLLINPNGRFYVIISAGICGVVYAVLVARKWRFDQD